jgi:hypothetical protein
MVRVAATLIAGLTTVLSIDPPDPAEALGRIGLSLRVHVLKRSPYEGVSSGPVLLGPQSALELDWRAMNHTGAPFDISSLDALLQLHLSAGGRRIPVHTEWATHMTLRSGANGERSTTLPVGATTLPDGASLWVRGSTTRLDGSAFAPGDYVLEPTARPIPQISPGGERTLPLAEATLAIALRIVALDSRERQRQFHLIEGGYYKGIDSSRALEHYVALVSLPGATWIDSLPLAELYADLGKHRDACAVYRRILPDLIRNLDAPPWHRNLVGRTVYLRMAAMSCAAEGDLITAADLLRLEGRTPQRPEEIERLRKIAPKPESNPKQMSLACHVQIAPQCS